MTSPTGATHRGSRSTRRPSARRDDPPPVAVVNVDDQGDQGDQADDHGPRARPGRYACPDCPDCYEPVVVKVTAREGRCTACRPQSARPHSQPRRTAAGVRYRRFIAEHNGQQ